MKLLEERILSEGTVAPGGIIKVDCFLNHRLDVALLNEIGAEFGRLFASDGVNKILTVGHRHRLHSGAVFQDAGRRHSAGRLREEIAVAEPLAGRLDVESQKLYPR